jgi:ketosteroid isomerase-like protein
VSSDATTRASESDPDIEVVLAAYAAFAEGDIDGAVAHLAPDVVWIEPDEFPNGGQRVGPQSVADYLRASREMWSELRSEPHAERRGERIVVIHRVSGRLATGEVYDNTVADVFTVVDGKVTRMIAYADPRSVP